MHAFGHQSARAVLCWRCALRRLRGAADSRGCRNRCRPSRSTAPTSYQAAATQRRQRRRGRQPGHRPALGRRRVTRGNAPNSPAGRRSSMSPPAPTAASRRSGADGVVLVSDGRRRHLDEEAINHRHREAPQDIACDPDATASGWSAASRAFIERPTAAENWRTRQHRRKTSSSPTCPVCRLPDIAYASWANSAPSCAPRRRRNLGAADADTWRTTSTRRTCISAMPMHRLDRRSRRRSCTPRWRPELDDASPFRQYARGRSIRHRPNSMAAGCTPSGGEGTVLKLVGDEWLPCATANRMWRLYPARALDVGNDRLLIGGRPGCRCYVLSQRQTTCPRSAKTLYAGRLTDERHGYPSQGFILPLRQHCCSTTARSCSASSSPSPRSSPADPVGEDAVGLCRPAAAAASSTSSCTTASATPFGGANIIIISVEVEEGTIFTNDTLDRIHRITRGSSTSITNINHNLVTSLTHRNTRKIWLTPDGTIKSESLLQPQPRSALPTRLELRSRWPRRAVEPARLTACWSRPI